MKLGWSGQAGTARIFILLSAMALLVFAHLHPFVGWAQDADVSGQAYYKNAKPMLDFPLPDLLKAVPELQGLDPAQNQDELPSILEKTGEVTDDLMASMPNLISQEDVIQTRPSARGSGRDQVERQFDYMIVVHWNGAEGSVEEYRTVASGAGLEAESRSQSYMLTSGFASEWLQFLPSNQLATRFRYLGQQTEAEVKSYVVAFAQVPGLSTITGTINRGGRPVLLLSQGIAWIDEASFRIIRLRTDMLAPHPEIGLEGQTTELQFGKTSLPASASSLWLPHEVVVTTQVDNRIFRNVHRYSNYRVFKVESKILPVPSDQAEPTKPN